jgi:uncharacterized membrane protein YfcA
MFAKGLHKTAALSEHQRSGLISLTVHPSAAAIYSHFKAPKHKQKEHEKNFLKHRRETAKGWAVGSVAGAVGGGALGYAGQKLHAHATGNPKSKYMIKLPGTKKGKKVPFFLAPAIAASFLGGNIGTYLGSKKGHEVVTGKKE